MGAETEVGTEVEAAGVGVDLGIGNIQSRVLQGRHDIDVGMVIGVSGPVCFSVDVGEAFRISLDRNFMTRLTSSAVTA